MRTEAECSINIYCTGMAAGMADHYMNAEESVIFGICDAVVTSIYKTA